MRTIKIYRAAASDLEGDDVRIVAEYPAFVVAEVADSRVPGIERQYLVEDITDQFHIEGAEASLNTAVPRISTAGRVLDHPSYATAEALPRGPHHYVVQFVGPIKKAWLTKLKRAGAEIVAPYAGFAVIARIGRADVRRVSAIPEVRWMGHLPYSARLAPRLVASATGEAPAADPGTPRSRYLPDSFVVEFFRKDLAEDALSRIRRAGFEIVAPPAGGPNVTVRATTADKAKLRARLDRLARIHGVQHVRPRPIRRPSNDRAAVIMATRIASAPAPGLGLSGKGEIIAVCDTGLDTGNAKDIHPDFQGRIVAIASYPICPDFTPYIRNPGANDGAADVDSGHGTHTSGSVLGDGTASSNMPGLAGPVRGLAHRAKLVMQAVEQELDWKNPADEQELGRFLLAGLPGDLRTLFDYAYKKGARIHSNSWGGGDAGAYDKQCRQVDDFVWKRRDFCILFSAGNDGRDGDGSGTIDEGSVTSPGTAKNCITVGASENDRPEYPETYGRAWPQDYPAPPISIDRLADDPDQVVAFSSRGPTSDGRIKPDIVAPGTYILSTRSRRLAPNNYGYGRFGASSLYMLNSGTSMATPLAAGAVALIREYLRTRQGFKSPSAALLKACVIASATPLAGHGPTPNNHQGFGRIAIDALLAPSAPLKPLFAEGPGIATGDVDGRTLAVAQGGHPLRIVLVYSDYPGEVLVNNLNILVKLPDGSVRVGNGGTGRMFDATNNVELVEIANAPAGDYSVEVIGANVPQGPQPFAIVALGALA